MKNYSFFASTTVLVIPGGMCVGDINGELQLSMSVSSVSVSFLDERTKLYKVSVVFNIEERHTLWLEVSPALLKL